MLRSQHSFSKRQGVYPFQLAHVLTQVTADHLLIQQSRKQTYCTVQHPILVAPVYSGTKQSGFGTSKES